MAYDEKLAGRVRKGLGRRKALTERKMLGGIAFMLRGHMCCVVVEDDLAVRVGPQGYQEPLVEPHARPMDFTGRSLKGFVCVGPGGYRTDAALARWVWWALEVTASPLGTSWQARRGRGETT